MNNAPAFARRFAYFFAWVAIVGCGNSDDVGESSNTGESSTSTDGQSNREVRKPVVARYRIIGDPRLVHWDWVNRVKYSPDGKMIAAASNDATVICWDAESGQKLQTLIHDNRVTSIDFSPDGKQLVGCGWGEVTLWDVASGRKVWSVKSLAAFESAFSRDGRTIAVTHGRHVALLDASTGEVRKRILVVDGEDSGTDFVRRLQFSPDGKTLAVSRDAGNITIWNQATGTKQFSLRGDKQDSAARPIDFSPNSRLLAAGFDDGSLCLWNAKTGARLRALKFDNEIKAVKFFDEDLLAVVSTEFIKHKIILLIPATGKVIRQFDANGLTRTIDFSPDGKTLASSGTDQQITLWDVKTGKPRKIRETSHLSVRGVAFSKDGKFLAVARNQHPVEIHELATSNVTIGETDIGFLTASGRIRIAFSPNANQLVFEVTQSGSGSLGVWSFQSGRRADVISGTAFSFAPDGTLFVGKKDGSIERTVGVKPGKATSFKVLKDSVAAMTISTSGELLAAADDLGNIKIWNVKTGRETRSLQIPDEWPEDWTRSLSFSPDGKLLAVNRSSRIAVWNVSTGRLIQSTSSSMSQILFNAKDNLLLIGREDGSVAKWDWKANREIARLQLGPKKGAIASIALSPDGQLIATANANGTVYLIPADATKVIGPEKSPK